MKRKTKALIAAADRMAVHFKGLLEDTHEDRYTKNGGCAMCYQSLHDYQQLRPTNNQTKDTDND